MPDSLEYFEEELRKAKEHHQLLKDHPEKRRHSMSLQYANKAVKDLQEKVNLAIRLWGDDEDIQQLDNEKKEAAEAKATKSKAKSDIIAKHNGFFAFNNDQFKEGIDKLKADGVFEEGDKVCHVGMGLYIPKKNVESFLKDYKKG